VKKYLFLAGWILFTILAAAMRGLAVTLGKDPDDGDDCKDPAPLRCNERTRRATFNPRPSRWNSIKEKS